MKQQIIDLWKISFGDTDDFIRLWFDRVYKDENTFVVRQNDKIVSALQILPCEMTYCGTTISAGYICGVCTLPSERGKGLMTRLMNQAVTAMHNRRYALAVLIPATPALFDLYRRFEFANAFDYSIEVIQYEELLKTLPSRHCERSEAIRHIEFQQIVSHEKLSLNTIYTYYNAKQLERGISIIHSAHQFETICRDRILGGCEIWVALANEQPVGLAFTDSIKDKTLSIREIMYENTEIKNQLVQSILKRHQLHSATLRIPPAPSNSVPYGMARIINVEHMIELYRSFHTHTQLLNYSNNDIPSLTQFLLHYNQRQACMNLMLD